MTDRTREDVVTLNLVAKTIGRALWCNDPDRPFTDAAWERELRWWKEADADCKEAWYADKCFRTASAVIYAIARPVDKTSV